MLKKLGVVCLLIWVMSGSVMAADMTISTADELMAFAVQTSYDGDATYTLANDITIPASYTWPGIGSETNFTGTFDGQGYIVTLPDGSAIGLFDRVYDANIRSVTVEGSLVATNSEPVGGLVKTWVGSDLDFDMDEIRNCVNAMEITSTQGTVGGLVGQVNGSLLIVESCNIAQRMTGLSMIGGLVGYWNQSAGMLELEDVYVITVVETVDGSTDDVNGFVGGKSSGSIINMPTLANTAYACMFQEIGGVYVLVDSLTPSGSGESTCKVVSDPSVDRADYDDYDEDKWLHVANAFPRLKDNNPYHLAQIMAAVVPMVDTDSNTITVRNVHGGTWSYGTAALQDGGGVTVTATTGMEMELSFADGTSRSYPLMEEGTYSVEFLNSNEGEIVSVAPLGGILEYTYEVVVEYGKSKFSDVVYDGIEMDGAISTDTEADGFTVEISEGPYGVVNYIELVVEQDKTGTQVGDVISGTIHFHDATTLAVGTVDFTLTVGEAGLGVLMQDEQEYFCTGLPVPIEYDILTSGYTLEPTITYYTDENRSILTTAADNGAEEEGGAPKYMGSYYYTAVFPASGDYEQTSYVGKYAIARTVLTETLKYSNSDAYDATQMVYDGNCKEVEYTDLAEAKQSELEFGFYYLLDSGTYVLTTADNSGALTTGGAPAYAGDYKREAEPKTDGHYITGTQSVTFSIKTATVNVVADGSYFVYDGNGQTPSYTLSQSGADYTAIYYVDENLAQVTTAANSGATQDGGTPVNSGDYWYAITLADSRNYVLGMIQDGAGNVLATGSCTFTIGEMTQILATLTGTTLAWSGTPLEPAIAIAGMEDLSEYQFSIAYYAQGSIVGVDTPLSAVPTDGGSYTFVVTWSDDYPISLCDGTGTGISATGTLTILAAEQWTEEVTFFPEVVYTMPACEAGESWQASDGICYQGGIQFYVTGELATAVTKITADE